MALEASEVAVRVRLLGGSAFEAEAQKVAASTEEIGAAGKKAAADAEEAGVTLGSMGSKLDSVGSKMMSFGRTLSTAGIGIFAAGYYASKTASAFQQDMLLLSTQAGESSKNLGWMSNAVLKLGQQFGQTPDDMAKALYWFESIGDHGKKALTDLKAAALGSAVGLDSLENTANAVSTVMASHIKGSGGPVEAMSLMDKAIGLGKMHLSDLTDSFKSGIVPMSQQFGMSFQQILADEAAVTRLGIPASSVTARMRLILTSMEDPTSAGAKMLSSLGVPTTQLATDLRGPNGLMTALKDLLNMTRDLGPIGQNQVLGTLFGRSRGMAQITSMLSSLPQADQIYAAIMGTTPSTLMGHFQQTSQTTAFKEKQIRAQFDADMVKLGDTINTRVLPVIIRLLPILQDVVNWFGGLPKPLQDFALGLAAAVVVGGPIFMFTGAIFKAAGMFMTGMEAIIGTSGMGALRAGIAMTTADFIALAAPVAAAVTVFELFNQKHGVFADVRHGIEGVGKSIGEDIGKSITSWTDYLGITHGALGNFTTQRFLHDSYFRSLNRVQQADIEGLLGGPGTWASTHTNQVGQDLKGVNLNDIPGLSEKIKLAIQEGMKDTNIVITLPNGRVLAQTVNEQNRKAQNRR